MPPKHPPGLRLRLRAFAGDADFPAMAEAANAVFAIARVGWVRKPRTSASTTPASRASTRCTTS